MPFPLNDIDLFGFIPDQCYRLSVGVIWYIQPQQVRPCKRCPVLSFARLQVVWLYSLPFVVSCSNVPGPDKTAEGAILGAGWGSGVGLVIANQTTGGMTNGALIGLAFGAASGMLSGLGLDVQEGFVIDQQREIDALKVQVAANDQQLRSIQAAFDDRQRGLYANHSITKIYFDEGRASLHMGSAKELERLAEAIRLNPYIGNIEVHGHSDDMGDVEKNNRISEARAKTVVTFLTEHGVSSHLMKLIAHGASEPITANGSPEGKQQNRRVEVVLLK